MTRRTIGLVALAFVLTAFSATARAQGEAGQAKPEEPSLSEKIRKMQAVRQQPQPQPTPQAVVADAQAVIQAGIVYVRGGPQAVARVNFMLLDESMVQFLSDQGCRSQDRNLTLLDAAVFDAKYGKGLICPSRLDAEALKPHVKGVVTTGFDGTAAFAPVPQGTYWIFGWTSTRGGFAVWDLKIDLHAGRWSWILDQDNAATSF